MSESYFLENLIDQLPARMFWKDREGRYLGCNRNFVKSLGLNSHQEIIGKTDFELPISRQNANAYRSDDQEVILSGYPKINIQEEQNCTNAEKEFLLTSKAPLYKNGQIVGVLGVNFNITDIAKFQQALENEKRNIESANDRQNEIIQNLITKYNTLQQINNDSSDVQVLEQTIKAYQDIIDCMPGNVYWLTADCRTAGCNRNVLKMFGFDSIEQFKGLTFHDLREKGGWTEEAMQKSLQDTLRVIKTGNSIINAEELPIPDVNGRITYFLTNRVPLFDKDKKIVGVVGISFDVTEIREMQVELIKSKRKAEEERKKAEMASKAKSEFIANMSHDLRTPITGIVGMLQDILDTAKEVHQKKEASEVALKEFSSSVERNAEIALGSVDELLQLCNEILLLVRLESGKLDKKEEAFDFHDLLRHNKELLQSSATHKKLNLSLDIDKRVPQYLKGLRGCLDRSLLNLLSNALKFTKKGSVNLSVKLFNNDSCQDFIKGDTVKLQIDVRDTGIGIPNDKFDFIFERFARLTSSYEGNYKGTGLGLYALKKYINAMDGDVIVKSELGRGSCFTLLVSLEVDDRADRKKESIRNPLSLRIANESDSPVKVDKEEIAKKTHVLIVEDSPAAAMAAKLALKRLDCSADVAVNGMEAVKKASENIYSLIFMDIGLPDMSGIEVTKAIRALANKKQSSVPIVALTGHAGDENRQDCLSAGMQDVLIKPAQAVAIDSSLQKWVWSKKPLQEIEEINHSLETLSVIDWEGCIKSCGSNPNTAYEMLSLLAGDLATTKKILASGLVNNDIKEMRAELHRSLGGVVYLKVPRLERALRNFHKVIKVEPPIKQEVEATYAELQTTIQAFWDAYGKLEVS